MVCRQGNNRADGWGFGSPGARRGRHQYAGTFWAYRADDDAGYRREDHVPAAAGAHRPGPSLVHGFGSAQRLTRKLWVGIPLNQALSVGVYVLRQHLKGRARYPLVLMLEPLFRCNLACAGCGKIQYPTALLKKHLSVDDCLAASDEC